MNEKFHTLPQEKQEKIINAALNVFSATEYRHASTDEIAKQAGISKGLIFHYFGSKSGLYIYAYNFCVDFLKSEMSKADFLYEKDFFESLKKSQQSKTNIMKCYPAIFQFILRAYYEDSNDVKNDVLKSNVDLSANSVELFLNRIDRTKFRENVDINKLMEIIICCGEGFMKQKIQTNTLDLNTVNDEFNDILEFFRQNVYKEEFLNERFADK